MNTVCEDGYVEATFETTLDPQGTPDATSYVLTSLDGGAPVRVTAVDVYERTRSDVVMAGTSSMTLNLQLRSASGKVSAAAPLLTTPQREPLRSALVSLPKAGLLGATDGDPDLPLPLGVTGVRLFVSKMTK